MVCGLLLLCGSGCQSPGDGREAEKLRKENETLRDTVAQYKATLNIQRTEAAKMQWRIETLERENSALRSELASRAATTPPAAPVSQPVAQAKPAEEKPVPYSAFTREKPIFSPDVLPQATSQPNDTEVGQQADGDITSNRGAMHTERYFKEVIKYPSIDRIDKLIKDVTLLEKSVRGLTTRVWTHETLLRTWGNLELLRERVNNIAHTKRTLEKLPDCSDKDCEAITQMILDELQKIRAQVAGGTAPIYTDAPPETGEKPGEETPDGADAEPMNDASKRDEAAEKALTEKLAPILAAYDARCEAADRIGRNEDITRHAARNSMIGEINGAIREMLKARDAVKGREATEYKTRTAMTDRLGRLRECSLRWRIACVSSEKRELPRLRAGETDMPEAIAQQIIDELTAMRDQANNIRGPRRVTRTRVLHHQVAQPTRQIVQPRQPAPR